MCFGIHLHRKDGASEGYTCWAETLSQAWIKAGEFMATGKYSFVEQITGPWVPPKPSKDFEMDDGLGP